jgi:hypothetical protein
MLTIEICDKKEKADEKGGSCRVLKSSSNNPLRATHSLILPLSFRRRNAPIQFQHYSLTKLQGQAQFPLVAQKDETVSIFIDAVHAFDLA